MLIRFSPAQRKQVTELASKLPKAFSELLSRDDHIVAGAVTALGAKEHPAAELIVLWACRQSGWEVRMAALECAQTAARPSLRDRVANDSLGVLGRPASHLDAVQVAEHRRLAAEVRRRFAGHR